MSKAKDVYSEKLQELQEKICQINKYNFQASMNEFLMHFIVQTQMELESIKQRLDQIQDVE